MQDSGLTDEDGQPTSTIIEIPLKKLTVNVEMGSTMLNVDGEMDSLMLSSKSHPFVGNSVHAISTDEASSPESDDSLLGRNGDDADKRLPDTYRTSPVLPAQLLMPSPSTSLHLQEKPPSENHYRYHHTGYASSSALDTISDNDDHVDSCSDFSYDAGLQNRRVSTDRSDIPVLSLNSLPNNTRQRLSSGSSLSSAFVVNELSSLYRTGQQPPATFANPTTGKVKLSDCLQNTLPKCVPALGREELENSEGTADSDEENPRHGLCNESLTVLNENLHMHPFSDDSYNPAGIGASASNYINKALLPKTNNDSLAQSFLRKTQTHHDHMCSAAESAQTEASLEPFCLDTVTKEELLVLWKSSEIELHKRLKAALKEKSRLERKLEMLQIHSLV